ncbi:DUF4124 domain-containing protein [Solimicrobium silvestre]|uniref:DUF4124 domain-containing protein n=1 Tax=Solimicrobium silvestre TaxID=2099400 RepID=UPI001A9CA657|nr:DUF4124 domain-containing protein [Solimicrobium silvestre]
MKLSVQFAILFISLPLQVQAGVFKCTLPDGSTSFQDTPCPANAGQSTVTLHSASVDSAATPKNTSLPSKEEKAEVAKLFASCAHAMDHWNAVKAAKATRSGTANSDAELKAAEKRVADECN